MRWIKKGVIFNASGQNGWMNSHAQVPVALVKEDKIRVFFASRKQQNFSLTTYVDLDIDNPAKILYLNPNPILDPGASGSFDEFGIMPSCVIEKDHLVYLYYCGWARGHSVPYSNYTGLAISEDGGNTFKKYSPGPILDRTPFEIYSATTPCIYYDNKTWHMFYSSGTHWTKINDWYEHGYDVKYAYSKDCINWVRTGRVVLEQGKTGAIAKQAIVKIGNIYHMWFCYRECEDFRGGKNSYKIGYASSTDLHSWIRDDSKSGISTSESGWDSEMIAYPSIVKVKNQLIMFYNGNNFGQTGFGYAILNLEDYERNT